MVAVFLRRLWENTMLIGRFSSSGLAGAYADDLAAIGIIAKVVFRPRQVPDPQPFVVEQQWWNACGRDDRYGRS